jgi:hypothetical protein
MMMPITISTAVSLLGLGCPATAVADSIRRRAGADACRESKSSERRPCKGRSVNYLTRPGASGSRRLLISSMFEFVKFSVRFGNASYAGKTSNEAFLSYS